MVKFYIENRSHMLERISSQFHLISDAILKRDVEIWSQEINLTCRDYRRRMMSNGKDCKKIKEVRECYNV